MSVLAHGVGGRADLPIPAWLFVYGATSALLISFVALRLLWPRPRLAAAAEGSRLPSVIQRAQPTALVGLRALGLVSFALVLYAAWFGSGSSDDNITPVAFCVAFWVGGQLAAASFGDVWWAVNPYAAFTTLSKFPDRTKRRDPGHWTAAAMLFAFVWLELAYHDGCADVRVDALWISAYSLAALAGARLWGRAWLRHGEGFAGLFGLLGHLSPLYRTTGGDLRLRFPITGLSQLQVRPGTAALIFVALGSTAYDSFAQTSVWVDLAGQHTGWTRTAVSTVLLVGVIAIVAAVYLGATRLAARVVSADPADMAKAYLPSLVPIVLAYTVAHYFSLVVFEGQRLMALASDPFGRGWDLFGTVDQTINYGLVSTNAIAYVQVASIVAGHVAAVVVAHDWAVGRFDARTAVRAQYPLLAAMVIYTIGGLALLLD